MLDTAYAHTHTHTHDHTHKHTFTLKLLNNMPAPTTNPPVSR